MKSEVVLYDTTLRDGAQREGLSLTVEDKLKIAGWLDLLGVQYIEGGWPGANPKDVEFFKRARDLDLKSATLACFGATRRPNVAASSDPGLAELLASEAPTVTLVAKSHPLQVTEALGTTLDENLAMVSDSVAFLVSEGREVFLDAEHFFDGFRADNAYALSVLTAAAQAGASCVILCDTNGGTLPKEIVDTLAFVRKPEVGPFGVHFHDDSGCAVANTLLAVTEGATQLQGAVNGIGERCGNANILTIAADLVLKMGHDVLTPAQLARLTEVHFAVAEICNLAPDPHQPFVGASAFATKAGLHTSGNRKLKGAYEHTDPSLVGNIARLLVSELSGRSTVVLKAKELGLTLEGDTADQILAKVKELEHAGYHFEAADASLELLMRREAGQEPVYFELESFRTIVEKREDGLVVSEATVKIHAGGERIVSTAEGNGPVNALDNALRRALSQIYPALDSIELVDYKVRILEENAGTDSVTRVLLESQDGHREWTTIGVSPNIIEASWEALVDSLSYGLDKSNEK